MSYFTLSPYEAKEAVAFMNRLVYANNEPDDYEGVEKVKQFFAILGYDEVLGLPEEPCAHNDVTTNHNNNDLYCRDCLSQV